MMKGGNEEERVVRPLFPRLHVKDTERGGPRAPPRNKMALFEQLSSPSQRFNHPLPPYDLSTTVSSAPSSQGGGHERTMLSPFYMHQSPAQSAQMVQSPTSNTQKHAREFGSLRKHDFSSGKSSFEEDDSSVPTFVHSDTTHSNRDAFMLVTERSTLLHRKSSKHEMNHTEIKSKEAIAINKHKEKPLSHLGTEEELAVDSRKAFSDQDQTSISNFTEKPCSNSAMNEPECSNAINDAENGDSFPKDSFGNSYRSSNMKDVENEVTKASMMDSVTGMEISPDDVVGEIGTKQFWKVRREIVNQQRVFAIQVFELHKLIKVQKLISASPHLLLEENSCLSGSPQKAANKNLPSKQKDDDSQKLRESTESQYDTRDPPSPFPMAPAHKQTAWFYPPANNWLVPVMSPTEGLIYKPCAGPLHGSSDPFGLPSPLAGGFMNAAYMVPNYFLTPYSLPFVGPTMAVEQVVGPVPGSRPTVQNEQWSKESELQGSTASSSSEQTQDEGRNGMPFNHHRTQVIKVVPRNARSATESVARIFELIQEERQHCES